jgi:hypothetical protein
MDRLSLVSAIFAKNVVNTIFFFAKREFAADVAEPRWRAKKPSGLRFGGSARLAESAGTRRGKKNRRPNFQRRSARRERLREEPIIFFLIYKIFSPN